MTWPAWTPVQPREGATLGAWPAPGAGREEEEEEKEEEKEEDDDEQEEEEEEEEDSCFAKGFPPFAGTELYPRMGGLSNRPSRCIGHLPPIWVPLLCTKVRAIPGGFPIRPRDPWLIWITFGASYPMHCAI